MRILVACLLLLSATPAIAQDWGGYGNARFGYAVDIPPGYEGAGEAANGDGQVFTAPDGTQELRVFGQDLMIPEFETAAAHSMTYHTNEGWRLSDERVTPGWASYRGTRNGLVLNVRMIRLCGGDQTASVELTYPERDMALMTEVADRVARSLKAAGTGAGCSR